MIFQNPFASLNHRKTVSEIIGEPLRLHNVIKSRKEREKERIILKVCTKMQLCDRKMF